MGGTDGSEEVFHPLTQREELDGRSLELMSLPSGLVVAGRGQRSSWRRASPATSSGLHPPPSPFISLHQLIVPPPSTSICQHSPPSTSVHRLHQPHSTPISGIPHSLHLVSLHLHSLLSILPPSLTTPSHSSPTFSFSSSFLFLFLHILSSLPVTFLSFFFLLFFLLYSLTLTWLFFSSHSVVPCVQTHTLSHSHTRPGVVLSPVNSARVDFSHSSAALLPVACHSRLHAAPYIFSHSTSGSRAGAGEAVAAGVVME